MSGRRRDASPATQLSFGDNGRDRREIAPGAVHVPDWLDVDEQRQLVGHCRAWAEPPAPLRATRLPGGGVMSAQTVCLGWHWLPYRYARTAEDVDGAPVKPFPPWLVELGQRAVTDAFGDAHAGADYAPDTALINSTTPTPAWGCTRTRTSGAMPPSCP